MQSNTGHASFPPYICFVVPAAAVPAAAAAAAPAL